MYYNNYNDILRPAECRRRAYIRCERRLRQCGRSYDGNEYREMTKFYLHIKYITDFIIALVGIILASPLMAAVAVAIKIEDGGNVLLRQSRTGRHGKKFTCYKFRSMKSADVPFDKNKPVIKDNNDNLTKVGKFIRKFKIDELPQIFNVLKGDMCFIGPRPLLPVYDCEYQEWELIKFEMRPGLTGLSQVRGNGLRVRPCGISRRRGGFCADCRAERLSPSLVGCLGRCPGKQSPSLGTASFTDGCRLSVGG